MVGEGKDPGRPNGGVSPFTRVGVPGFVARASILWHNSKSRVCKHAELTRAHELLGGCAGGFQSGLGPSSHPRSRPPAVMSAAFIAYPVMVESSCWMEVWCVSRLYNRTCHYFLATGETSGTGRIGKYGPPMGAECFMNCQKGDLLNLDALLRCIQMVNARGGREKGLRSNEAIESIVRSDRETFPAGSSQLGAG